MLRLSWTQPEDLAAHALMQARLDGVDVTDLEDAFASAGGSLDAPVSGATPTPASAELRDLALRVIEAACAAPRPAALLADEPDERIADGPPRLAVLPGIDDRMQGAWLGRAVGCLVGKPVEKIPRHGIEAIARSTGHWPVRGYFTEVGLDPTVAAANPWNRRSRPTSMVESIDGMPEDDDINFAVLALVAHELHGGAITTERIAQLWLDRLPAGRVFTAERIAYRNLLAGVEPDVAGETANPFIDWIGALIRADAHGWTHPGDAAAAATAAIADARLSHRRAGVHGAAFMAAASAVAVAGHGIEAALEAGLAVVPPRSRLAAAVRLGREIAVSDLGDDAGLDALHDAYGHLHWVHVLGNVAVIAFAATRGRDDFARGVGLATMAGWDTDSAGASVGALLGAAIGRAAIPTVLTEPIHGIYRTSLSGFDGITFDELAARTLAVSSAGAAR